MHIFPPATNRGPFSFYPHHSYAFVVIDSNVWSHISCCLGLHVPPTRCSMNDMSLAIICVSLEKGLLVFQILILSQICDLQIFLFSITHIHPIASAIWYIKVLILMQIPFAFFFHYLKFWYHIQEYIHIYLFFIVSSLITCKTHKREKSVFLCSLFYLLLFGFVFYVVKRTTRESASLSIMWVPGVELAYQTGLVASSFQPLNHLVA